MERRGNKYSSGHTTLDRSLDADAPSYWDFTMQDIFTDVALAESTINTWRLNNGFEEIPTQFLAVQSASAEIFFKASMWDVDSKALFLQPIALFNDSWVTIGLLPPKEPSNRLRNLEGVDIAADGSERVGRSTRRLKRGKKGKSSKSSKSSKSKKSSKSEKVVTSKSDQLASHRASSRGKSRSKSKSRSRSNMSCNTSKSEYKARKYEVRGLLDYWDYKQFYRNFT